MDVPITIAIFSTFAAGLHSVINESGDVYFESICMFVFFLISGRYLEQRAKQKATQVSSNMLKLLPATALKLIENNWVNVLAKQLNPNDIVLVKAGETVPVDGYLVAGETSIDESMLSGEFVPIKKSVGSKVFAGTLNQLSSIEIKVSCHLKHALMNQIIRLQETAFLNKPKAILLADKFSQYFVATVLLISVATYGLWTFLGNKDAFWITVSVLVATCPCALGLATPTALTCAIARLNQLGILLRRSDALAQIPHASDIVFDKTGTLTQGKYSVLKCEMMDGDYTEQEALALVSFVEQYSEHPIAKAFHVQEYSPNYSIKGVKTHIGKGIEANVDSKIVLIGSQQFVLAENKAHQNPRIAGANVLLSVDSKLIAAFWLSDTVRIEAHKVLSKLSAYDLSILSGDEELNVRQIADILGIDRIFANQSPMTKLHHVCAQQADKKSLIMIGDGINDAPVLAAADVSIAVGNATDLAKNAADVIFLHKRLDAVLDLLSIAKKCHRTIKQNITWALAYNILVLPIAILGILAPWQAAIGMSLSSVIVVYNSSRLFHTRQIK